MALSKEMEEEVTVLSDGQLQVKETTIISEDGVVISRANHRHVVDVGDDVTNAPAFVKEIAEAVHTPTRIAVRAAKKAAIHAAQM